MGLSRENNWNYSYSFFGVLQPRGIGLKREPIDTQEDGSLKWETSSYFKRCKAKGDWDPRESSHIHEKMAHSSGRLVITLKNANWIYILKFPVSFPSGHLYFWFAMCLESQFTINYWFFVWITLVTCKWIYG